MRKFRTSYKIAIGFAVVALLSVYGYRYANYYMLGREHFPAIAPGEVNVIGLDTSAGYGILIENRIAKLVFGGGGRFEAPKDDKGLQESGADRKFIPIREMLNGLRGDVAGLTYFVERINDITDEILQPDAPIWKMEDIEKALKGEKTLQAKLVRDINMNLDGTPLDSVRTSALFNGITVEVPIPFQIPDGNSKRTVVARVKRPYRAAFITRVEGALAGKFANAQTIANEYAAIAEQLKRGELQKEDIPARLRAFNEGLQHLAETPQSILNSITPVINEDQITGARYETKAGPKGDIYTLVISLNDEGKKRLWQFSHNRVGDQLLLTVRGVAIAAPFIDHELASGEVRISGLADDALVEDAVATINEKRAKTTK